MLTGVRSSLQAAARVAKAVPACADVHAQRKAPQVPRAVRAREGHQGGQPVAGAERKVSIQGRLISRWECYSNKQIMK